MMKKLYFNMLLIAGVALAACSSDDHGTEQPVYKTYYMTVDATKGVNEAANRMSTRFLELEGNTLNATWAVEEDEEKQEHVYVQGTYKSDGVTKFWFKGSIKPQYAGTTTRLNGVISLPDGTAYTSIDDAIGTPHTVTLQFPRSGYLDYTGQIGTLADIAAKYDYAIASDVRVDVEADKVKGVYEVMFENQQSIVKFTLVDKADGTTLLNPSALTIQYGETVEDILSLTIPAATYTTNGNGVLFVAIPGFSGQTVTLTATVGSETYTYTTTSSVTFVNGQYYDIVVEMQKASN